MRTRVLALFLLGCGGQVEPTENQSPTPDPVNAPAPAPIPAPVPDPSSNPPPSKPAPEGETTATRDGSVLYVTMCKKLDEKRTALHVWGSIFDPEFEVDEGIIALDVTPPDARGTMTCGKDVRVVFAEHRGADFEVDPKVCSVQLSTNALGQVEGHVKAEYDNTLFGQRHSFTLDFTAGDCN